MAQMLTSVQQALSARVAADPRDAAAERLAEHYAGLIDEAAPAAKYLKALKLLGRAVSVYAEQLEDEDAEQLAAAYETTRIALSEHSVTSDLGPKLLAVLTSLGLTTAGRGAAKDGGGHGVKPSNPIDEIKQQREERARRSAGGAG